MKEEKRALGQYYTEGNPFKYIAFRQWFEPLLKDGNVEITEPFAGANNIPRLIKEAGFNVVWDCYDISPPDTNSVPEFNVHKQDTLANFPKSGKGTSIVITNPPYLAKNSATRRHLSYPETIHDDLYKYAVEIMLNNADYVAAIVPESFITADVFKERLSYVISITEKIFSDTECPVCLALFNKDRTDDFQIWCANKYIGKYNDIITSLNFLNTELKHKWIMNSPNGSVGCICVDSATEESICFVRGTDIASDKIKVSSRAYTRVSGLPENVDVDIFISKCNNLLKKYRDATKDVFLTSFKGLRKDGKYRRRIDFGTVKQIMNKALVETQTTE
jgi:hypothetical protein